jgi:hypothetical protein
MHGTVYQCASDNWWIIRSQDCGTEEVTTHKFFPIEGPDGRQHPLCERDYFGRLSLICTKCNKALRGSYITACSTHIFPLHCFYHLNIMNRQKVSRRTFHLFPL